MPRFLHRRARRTAAMLVGLGAVMTCPAIAQEIPLKPGLWETQVANPQGDAMREQMMKKRLDDMPEAKRAEMEKRMAEASGRKPHKVCLTAERLKRGMVTDNTREGCESNVTWRGKTSVVDMACKDGVSSHGELTYPNPETYKGWIEFKNPKEPDAMRRIEMNGRWLGADCGDIAPPKSGR